MLERAGTGLIPLSSQFNVHRPVTANRPIAFQPVQGQIFSYILEPGYVDGSPGSHTDGKPNGPVNACKSRKDQVTPERTEQFQEHLRLNFMAAMNDAIEWLGADGKRREQGIHQARKAMRRARSLLQLAQKDLGLPAAACDVAIKRDCRLLSEARDAQAQLETLDILATINHGRVHDGTFERLRRSLMQRLSRATRSLLEKDSELKRLRSHLGVTRDFATDLPWHRVHMATLFEALKHSRHRAKKVAPKSRNGGSAKHRHRWRRRLRRWSDQKSAISRLGSTISSQADFPESKKKLSRLAHALGAERDLKKLDTTLKQIKKIDATQRQRLHKVIRLALRDTKSRR